MRSTPNTRCRTLLATGTGALLAITLATPVDAAPRRSSDDPALAGSPTAAAARAGTRAFIKRATIPVKVGPKRDRSCTVAADLYRPRGVDSRHRAPAILTTNGFGAAKDDANQKGIGRSGCKIYLDTPAYDGKAACQLVSVLNGTKRAFDADTGEALRIGFRVTRAPR